MDMFRFIKPCWMFQVGRNKSTHVYKIMIFVPFQNQKIYLEIEIVRIKTKTIFDIIQKFVDKIQKKIAETRKFSAEI